MALLADIISFFYSYVIVAAVLVIYALIIWADNLKLLIPYTLIVGLGIILNIIQNTSATGNVFFLDYFRMKKLEVILAFIFAYAMAVFIIISIIFSYNSVYTNPGSKNYKCDPFLYYLGSQAGCIRAEPMDNMSPANEVEETVLEKLVYIANMLIYPISASYMGYNRLNRRIGEFRHSTQEAMESTASHYLEKQGAAYNTWRQVFVDPILLRVTDPLYKKIQAVIDMAKGRPI
jgi:hypothetical protein